ncbi:hypothetical protein [Micromonospora sp. WMMD812]|uniref:hypothetical protein n=1 Tax=Micromonospora sp. WMMD812 TaxID=3015152 RepID=UPI00248CF96E|nr:hypothetical protein [Micromonospora sp. WMMD812]WBB65640.1 hypothetical protein O7603_20855 [Micromonospora sp. WMMD812]
MTDVAKQVAKQAEDRLDKIAETVQERFDEIIKGRFTDVVKEGRFADQVDHGIDEGRAETRPDRRGGPG